MTPPALYYFLLQQFPFCRNNSSAKNIFDIEHSFQVGIKSRNRSNLHLVIVDPPHDPFFFYVKISKNKGN